MFLSIIMDLFNNEIVANKIGTRQGINLVLIHKPEGVILHINQGSVYTSYAFQNLAKEKGITTSMSLKGNCHDNGVIESYHSSLKSEEFKVQSRASMNNSIVVQIVINICTDIIIYAFRQNKLPVLLYRGQAA